MKAYKQLSARINSYEQYVIIEYSDFSARIQKPPDLFAEDDLECR